MSGKIRLFIAIDLPEDVKDLLLETAVRLAKKVPNRAVRWVQREQMHLTLRFLGDTAVSQLPKLRQEITQVAARYQPIQLRLSGVGAFPQQKRPRVVWAGLAGNLEPLREMQAKLEDQIVAMGWVREKRPFNPHITLGRVKNAQQARGLAWDVELAEIEFGVTAVQLVESELRPSGAVYTVRHKAPLSANITLTQSEGEQFAGME
ncbi:MAG: RNA 2',3'-cyclic phosphodiesterase [Ardenticatenaceae bacterium]|nr:MAG: RNA 2',3'-cyclic phosphodiesterase [Ardenticatenaceae bacterium]